MDFAKLKHNVSISQRLKKVADYIICQHMRIRAVCVGSEILQFPNCLLPGHRCALELGYARPLAGRRLSAR